MASRLAIVLTLLLLSVTYGHSQRRYSTQSRGRSARISGRSNTPKPRVDAYDDVETTMVPQPVNPGNIDGNVPPKPPSDIGANGCICVPYYQCANGSIIDDGTGIIDPRIKKPPKQELPLNAGYQPPYCGTFHVCCSDPQTTTQQPYTHRCGIRNPSGINSRVLTPEAKGEADFGEWPWQAAILKADKEGNLFQCGGVLIDEFHVLTVAHCVSAYINQAGALVVRLGEWDTAKEDEFLPHADYNVIEIVLHPEYISRNLWNDIAVLKLDKKVVFAPNIESICLPAPNDNFDHQECVVTGWGKNAYRGGMYSNILKEISVPVIPYEQCLNDLRQTRLGLRFRLHKSFMCAGGKEGRDSCKGDGGGPLTCYRKDGHYVLAGLVSWGIDCGQPNVPGVYVKVQHYTDWVSQVTGVEFRQYRPTRL